MSSRRFPATITPLPAAPSARRAHWCAKRQAGPRAQLPLAQSKHMGRDTAAPAAATPGGGGWGGGAAWAGGGAAAGAYCE